jgi:uncharacterized RDD family membrane protein YckC
MQVIQIATPFNIDIEFELAPFYKRLLAYLFDFTMILLYIFIIRYTLYEGLKLGESSRGFVIIILLLPTLLYIFVSELLFNGQTAGKRLALIKVMSLRGGEPTVEQFLLRFFLRFFEWGFLVLFIFQQNFVVGAFVFFIGGLVSVIIMAATGKSQRLGDIVANTVVVNTRSTVTVDDTIFTHITHSNYQVTFPEVMRLSDRDLNTVKNVIVQSRRTNSFDMCNKVAFKVQDVLKVSSDMYAINFLEKLIEDYNYLSSLDTNEKH